MSRTYRNKKYRYYRSHNFYSEKSLIKEWEDYRAGTRYSLWGNKDGLKTFEEFKKYTLYRVTSESFLDYHGYRGGSNGFLFNGRPTGYSDDLPRTKIDHKYVNSRRRQWDKKIINQELEMHFEE